MSIHRIALLVTVAALMAIPALPQTAGELLQKGIYTQDTAGDLDGAIAIYRQIVNSGNSPRDIAAQAQYRLAQSLLQKGDLANGATEFSNLARNYADYSRLISNLAAEASKRVASLPPFAGGRGGRGGTAPEVAQFEMLRAEADALKAAMQNAGKSPADQSAAERAAKELAQLQARFEVLKAAGAADASSELQARQEKVAAALARIEEITAAQQRAIEALTFDSGNPVTLQGFVTKIQSLKPNGLISVARIDGTGKQYTFVLSRAMLTSFPRIGDEVTAVGNLATGGQLMPDGTIAAVATTITNASGVKIYDRGQAAQ